jgi:hypothetical protein
MGLPFSIDQFLDVFRLYNEAVWPAQTILVILAVSAVLVAYNQRFARAPGGILALLWFWMGAVYHFGFFRSINPAATLFAALFIAQAGIFAWYGFVRRTLVFERPRDRVHLAGLALMVFALLGYPLAGWFAGHQYPATPTFGLPCPTTIFTFGLLLLARRPLPRAVFVIPVLWSIIATTATVQLGMVEDFTLLPAAVIATGLAFRRARRGGELRLA